MARYHLPMFVGYGQLNQGISMCRKTLAKLKFVGYGQLNYTTVLHFAPGMCYTSYLNMQHLGAGNIFFVLVIPAILYHRSITTDILE